MGNTAYLNITVRVASAQAMAAMKQLNAATKGLGATGGAAAGGLSAFNLSLKATNLERFGKNLQWTGRQLQYNFTLPLVIAGYAVGKWALENERAMTRVRMVYGGAADDQAMLKKETDALAKSFELLSSRFGVHQNEVIDIAQAWAEAGVAGVGLAKATQLTIEVMKIAGLDQEKAVLGLMAIQSAYKLNTTQLREQIALLAGINKTGTITFGGLIEVIQRAGGAARAAGIDIQHLAAMANVLTPAAGSASQAGNALRTMISRLQAPTRDTVEILGLMGINVKEAAWQAKTGVDKFETLAVSFDGLTQSQKNLVSSVIASRWQINRFDILMEDINSSTGAYRKALNETGDNTRNLAIYNRMLVTSLSSTPTGLAILTNTMRNSLTRAFLPMMPAILGLLAHVTRLFVWFGKLDPRIQQLAMGFLLMLALVGPIVKYMGAFTTLASIGVRVVGLLTVAISREAAASAIAASANSANAGSMHGLGLATAHARVWLGAFVAELWAIATFPFRAIGAAMGFMWRATVVGSTLAVKGLIVFIQWLAQLPVVQRAVATVGAAISAALGAAWAFAAGVAHAAWVAVGASLPGLWTTILFAADVAVTAIQFAWIAGINAIEAAWVLFAGFMSKLWVMIQYGWVAAMNGITVAWRTLPAIMGIIGQGIALVWMAVVEAIQLAWINLGNVVPLVMSSIQITAVAVAQSVVFVWGKAIAAVEYLWIAALNGIEVAWRTLPVIIGIIGQGVGLVWQKVVVFLHGVWLAVIEGMQLAWSAFTTFVGAAMAMLPGILVVVGEALEGIWLATATTMQVIWAAMTTGIVGLIEVLPFVLAGVADAIIVVMTSPWGLVIAGVVAFVILFRKQIGDAVNWVVKKFYDLPLGIGNVLRTIVQMLAKWAEAVSHWLSYINPFARHSPSLVEQVIAGIDVIARQYSRLSNIGTVFRKAVADMEAFKAGISGIVQAAQDVERSQLLADAGSAAPQLRQLWASEDALRVVLEQVGQQYIEQGHIVTELKTKLDALDATLTTEKQRLNELEAAADSARRALDAAKDTLSDLQSYQLTGMRAAEDAIFANEMAQKQLQLQILQMEDAAGGSLDELKDKMAKLRGEMEMLTGERDSLRQAGAGSEITAAYDEQISKLEEQQQAIQDIVAPINEAAEALKDLQREGQILDLQKSLNFDPQLRQIDQLVSGLKEMPFDELYQKISNQKALVDTLQGSYDAINQQVGVQKDKVDALQLQRDALNATYDLEYEKLQQIGQAYDDIANQIDAMEAAVQQLTSSQETLKKAAGDTSLNQELFNAGQDYEVPGGTSTLGREGGLADIEKFNEEMQKELDKTLAGLGKIDLFKPFKDMWNSGWKWIKKNVGPVVGPIWDDVVEWTKKGIGKVTGGQGLGSMFGKFKTAISTGNWSEVFAPISQAWDGLGKLLEDTPLETTFENLSQALGTMGDAAETLWEVFSDTLLPGLKEMAGWFLDAGKTIGKELAKWGDLFDPFMEAIGHIYTVVSWFFKVVEEVFKVGMGIILALWTFLWPIFLNVLRPIFDAIVGLIRAALEIARGIIQFILALINGDWGQAWNGIKTILAGVWDAIFTVVKFAFGLVYGVIKGTLEGIVDLFKFLWDHFLGGIFEGLLNNVKRVWNAIGDAIRAGINLGIDAINLLIDGLNLVAKILPGIDFHINHINHVGGGGGSQWGTATDNSAGTALVAFARGGVLPTKNASAGFMTSTPRAIVGEGNRLYPEYVIPTDPRHRGRAIGLLRAATASLTGNATGLATAAGNHNDETGGFGLHTITDPLKDLVGAFRKGAAIAAFAGPLAAANVIIDRIPWKFLRELAHAYKNKVYNWVKGEDDKAAGAAAASTSTLSGIGYQPIINWMKENAKVPYRVTSTLRVGDPGFHGIGRAVDFAGPSPSRDSNALLGIYQTLVPVSNKLAELIYAGPGARSYKNGQVYNYSSAVMADHHDHVHAALANGGRMLFARRPGGTLLRLGEGRSHEEIQVKPLRHDSTDGERHFHFYGDLEFPNVKDGKDAESFIRNLESIV